MQINIDNGRLDLRNQSCSVDEMKGMRCGMWGKRGRREESRQMKRAMQSQLAQYFFLSLENCLPGAKATRKQICNSKLVTWLRVCINYTINQPPTRIQLTYDNAKVLTGKWPSYGGDRTDLCHCLSASVVTCFVRTRYGQHCSQTTDVLLFYFGTRTQVPPATCIQSQPMLSCSRETRFFLTHYCSSVKILTKVTEFRKVLDGDYI
ncbi:hypothetical protein T07_3203 [Trichinella nelsoni]|uniref:Uncharacterized protein n=1 Tax=Trichinella nelsoni TaxID=6336 RepID=A0A0V0RXT1_9BILA|nr:hypothetical protein T07_3203 [Trichinella nelsoni]